MGGKRPVNSFCTVNLADALWDGMRHTSMSGYSDLDIDLMPYDSKRLSIFDWCINFVP